MGYQDKIRPSVGSFIRAGLSTPPLEQRLPSQSPSQPPSQPTPDSEIPPPSKTSEALSRADSPVVIWPEQLDRHGSDSPLDFQTVGRKRRRLQPGPKDKVPPPPFQSSSSRHGRFVFSVSNFAAGVIVAVILFVYYSSFEHYTCDLPAPAPRHPSSAISTAHHLAQCFEQVPSALLEREELIARAVDRVVAAANETSHHQQGSLLRQAKEHMALHIETDYLRIQLLAQPATVVENAAVQGLFDSLRRMEESRCG
ncbi:hypothetical protein Tdes44962_MAKER06314 [Teratosphaeria destructans]|uniref:Transmembrane protein n=1 Tax=Teratosphaeria destructans TaxID=418781 RepID=A0A9W7VXJ4_9PEZI|nr:hypothetical protein Tdes44962_MAKER06314 [Teratosphaeria destructans]